MRLAVITSLLYVLIPCCKIKSQMKGNLPNQTHYYMMHSFLRKMVIENDTLTFTRCEYNFDCGYRDTADILIQYKVAEIEKHDDFLFVYVETLKCKQNYPVPNKFEVIIFKYSNDEQIVELLDEWNFSNTLEECKAAKPVDFKSKFFYVYYTSDYLNLFNSYRRMEDLDSTGVQQVIKAAYEDAKMVKRKVDNTNFIYDIGNPFENILTKVLIRMKINPVISGDEIGKIMYKYNIKAKQFEN